MIIFRLALSVLIAAAVAACFTHFVALPSKVEADRRSPPTVPSLKGAGSTGSKRMDDPRPRAEAKDVVAYQQAADAILRRVPYVRASADERPITGPIPLPKRRPKLP